MILPNKIIALDKSILGIGAQILSFLDNPLTVSALWDISKKRIKLNSFQYFVLALSFLYLIGAIYFKNNRIYKGAANVI